MEIDSTVIQNQNTSEIISHNKILLVQITEVPNNLMNNEV